MARILCVVGPTASGKTKFGVALAKRYNGEVVSVDSMQIYRGMEIGTAAPTKEEMEGIPHHMIGVADPKQQWSVAKFTEEADKCIQDVLSRGKLPVLVGGTGLYLDALVRGTEFAPGEQSGQTRKKLQERAQTEGIEALLQELQKIDPECAQKLHLKDEKRILRALEVYYETGKTMTEHNEETQKVPNRYEALYIGLNFKERQDLRERIDKRVDIMVEQGLLKEVEDLLNSGISRDATALQAIGYKQFLGVSEGKLTQEQAVEEVKLRSRQYAKRQVTWLRRNEQIHWILWDTLPDLQAGLEDAATYLDPFLLGETRSVPMEQ